ncbi:helix-turn-helix transcriptional regulator [Nesterenkonia sp. MY13]|uniref:Helix-turn-helix transcriptional regulator n=1 Tax=Nesterenkonia sedimenti TaxID=1463632 RepID=A0A7X8TIG1_9MICC|nr:metalloregulator ArsR/SmtB family transcription factor [Nesterenkonia sedimenti]NLS09348.1 helix-turn-helix transcriptional regulator [Nesterenkonia sedimenti]
MDSWQAIADPSRRQILVLLSQRGEVTAGEIAENFTSTRSAISQHLAVLRAAGLVSMTAQGRRRLYRLHLPALQEVRSQIESFWTQELDTLAQEATAIADQRNPGHDRKTAR